MLKIIHTGDWHLGYVSGQLEPHHARELARARLTVVERILGEAALQRVHCVLCAGDLFESWDPAEQWWQGLLDVFAALRAWEIPILLLPGNHDPVRADSVYSLGHPFRAGLPDWVHVVDDDGFEFEIPGQGAVVLAAPCKSTAGSHDLALSLPEREPDDTRIRIGLVHGSTFDLPGYQFNFPIDKDAPQKRGLDYLAIGDTHGFREIVPGAEAPTVYPGAPEPTRFAEQGAGSVAVVSFRRRGRRPRLSRVEVGAWRWEERTVRSVEQVHALLGEELDQTVLRLRLEFGATVHENEQLEADLRRLGGTDAVCGRVGVLVVDRSGLHLDVEGSELPDGLPELLYEVRADLEKRATENPRARAALVSLHRLVRKPS